MRAPDRSPAGGGKDRPGIPRHRPRRLPLAGIAALALTTLVFVRPAAAYIDPGTGSYILQTVLGVLFGLLYALKIYWQQVKAFVLRVFARKPAPPKTEG